LLKDFPISETIGIFVGIAGYDWLAEGHADPMKALLCALSGGLIVLLYRHIRSHD
jgi:hypothetical protein